MIKNAKYILCDIDNTLTRYVNQPFELLHGNFLFPIFRDMMLEQGWEKAKAEAAILQLIRDIPFWDYTDFIAEIRLPVEESFRRCYAWHEQYLDVYDDAIALVKKFHAEGRTLFVISNNPYAGCCWKLKRAGLADDFSSPYFKRIFSTDKVRGCKCNDGVWPRALAQIPASPEEIAVIGDNPVEDRDIPMSLGCREFIIFDRKSERPDFGNIH